MCVQKLMRHYKCTQAVAEFYVSLRMEGYPRETALTKAGLS